MHNEGDLKESNNMSMICIGNHMKLKLFQIERENIRLPITHRRLLIANR